MSGFKRSHGARHAVTSSGFILPSVPQRTGGGVILNGEKNGDLACISKKCCIFATSIAKNLKFERI
jgi:hypothetical protein